MARSVANQQAAPISLFPMFNILVATLGVLVFIQIAVVVVSLGLGKAIVFVPDAGGEEIFRKPVYIEWADHELTLHPEKDVVEIGWDFNTQQTWPELWAHFDNLLAGSRFETLFEEVKEEGARQHVILIVRPSGFDDFWVIRGYFNDRAIPIGYEPLAAGVQFRER